MFVLWDCIWVGICLRRVYAKWYATITNALVWSPLTALLNELDDAMRRLNTGWLKEMENARRKA